MNMNSVPYHLANFKIDYLEHVLNINDKEKRLYPPAFIPTNSQKKNKASKTFLWVYPCFFIVPFYVAGEVKNGSGT